MKYLYRTLILFCVFSCTSNKYDLSAIENEEDLEVLVDKLVKDELIDSSNIFSFIIDNAADKGFYYKNIPIKTFRKTDLECYLKFDTLHYNNLAQSLLKDVEGDYGIGLLKNNKGLFRWEFEDKNIDLNLIMDNNSSLINMNKNDYAILNIYFKHTYKDISLANVHKEIKEYEETPIYMLKTKAYGLNYKVFVNGIEICSDCNDYKEIIINKFLLNSEFTKISFEFIQRNEIDDEKKHFEFKLLDENTGEVLDSIEEDYSNDRKKYELFFSPKLLYYPKGWSKGVDLRGNIDELDQEIINIYQEIGKVILGKDKKKLSEILYEKELESRQSINDRDYETSREIWNNLLIDIKYSYKYTVEKHFDIQFYDEGKLIYAKPLNRTGMLTLTGKDYSSSYTYFLYKPKGSNELKIIR